ncbi:hypothetical protein GCM10010451_00210 [Streptomyces virens]|uniref:Uncharacterized protein n=2 Tax=Streptomyces TaxID=1883 RepID=A0A514JPF0_9ACTN|nr:MULTISPECIES: hypothetical protein [Streptomyces]MBA8974615.1 hypothetical protein [Streptomyces calvus]MYS32209.1 hypothetical protein [Streptomyces sp. SID7804]QDI69175.1 hypothetical protein CD934_11030 [Streptomyces calvus]
MTDLRVPNPSSPPGAADPVKALLHHHRDLCRRAVDPLEIAAGLEAHGITDRSAARFRHRDVFSLAEELYARVPRDGEPQRPLPTTPPPGRGADRTALALLPLLPGVLCAATVLALKHTHGQDRLHAAAAGVLALALAVRAVLRRGPLGPRDRLPARSAKRSQTCWLIGYALLGGGLLGAALTGGPDGLPDGTAQGDWPLSTAPVLALALSCAPAAWTTHLFTTHARRRLAASRDLEDFAASVRPALFGTFALYLAALAALVTASSALLDEPLALAETLTLGALLLLSRLLTLHGFTHAPKVILTLTAAAQAAALATVFAARLPGCGALATPVETLTAWNAAAVPALTCGAAALILLVHATRTLTRASAHTPAAAPTVPHRKETPA